MFNVSALLLDDALKPATPLTNGANFWATLYAPKVVITKDPTTPQVCRYTTTSSSSLIIIEMMEESRRKEYVPKIPLTIATVVMLPLITDLFEV